MEIYGDYQTSVIKALTEIDKNWRNYKGLIICGSHNPCDIEFLINKIKEARENNIPFLGICWGMQLMIIELFKNIFNFNDANTEELEPNSNHLIFIKLSKVRVGIQKVNGKNESHWHNYVFNNKYRNILNKDYLHILFEDDILEYASNKNNSFFKGVQYHPEYNSSSDNPHPILKEFLNICHFKKDINGLKNKERNVEIHQKDESRGIKGLKMFLNILKRLKIK